MIRSTRIRKQPILRSSLSAAIAAAVILWGCTSPPPVVDTAPAPPLPAAAAPDTAVPEPSPELGETVSAAEPSSPREAEAVPPARDAEEAAPPAGETVHPRIPSEREIVHAFLSSITIEEKIGQLIFVDLRNLAGAASAVTVSPQVIALLDSIRPGGIILFSESFKTIPQVWDLIFTLQQVSDIPLFIATDQEGGVVSRLSNREGLPATTIPSQETIGSTGDPAMAYLAAEIIGRELYCLGVNMNFAPVADLVSDPESSVIGSRSYGSDADLVARMVGSAVEGIQGQGVSSVVKHFPGHGEAPSDTHAGESILDFDEERFMSRELIPFIAAIEAGCDGIMTAHLRLPRIVKDPVPATFSPYILQTIMRERLGFEGLIITDSLSMKAVELFWDAGEAAVLAVEAGADILLMPRNPHRSFRAVLDAVASGRIPEERIDRSVERILYIKLRRGILGLDYQALNLDPSVILGSEAHAEGVERIRSASGKND